MEELTAQPVEIQGVISMPVAFQTSVVARERWCEVQLMFVGSLKQARGTVV